MKKTFTKEETKDSTEEDKEKLKRAVSLFRKWLSVDVRESSKPITESNFSLELQKIISSFEVSKQMLSNICETIEYKKNIISVLAYSLCEVYIKSKNISPLKSADSFDELEMSSQSNDCNYTDMYAESSPSNSLRKIKNKNNLEKWASLSSIQVMMNNDSNMNEENYY